MSLKGNMQQRRSDPYLTSSGASLMVNPQSTFNASLCQLVLFMASSFVCLLVYSFSERVFDGPFASGLRKKFLCWMALLFGL